MKSMNWLVPAVAALTIIAAGTAVGAPVDSYNMLNGNTGSYNYWDQIYSGAGCVTCDNAALTGGKGDLTDGIIATQNWSVAEAPAGNGPYVGWTLDPTITFHFNSPTTINTVTFYLDDSNGTGGVSAPGSIVVNGVTYVVAEPAGSAPFSFTAGSVGFTGTDLAVTLIRKNSWVFLSEVEFNGVSNGIGAVPEPSTWAMLIVGFAGVGFMAYRRRSPVTALRIT